MWMSGSRVQSSEHEQRTYDEPSEPLAPELAVSSSRELSSNSLSNPKAISSSPRGIETYSTGSELRRALSPSAFSLSKSRSPSDPRSQSNEHSSISSPGTSSSILPNDGDQTIRHIIVRSFAPRVAVYASTDTEDFVKGKGFKEGLHGLVRPYGERLQGKVIIRDGVGGSKAWDDFGVRLLGSQQLNQSGTNHSTLEALDPDSRSQVNGNPGTAIDQVLDHFLQRNDGGMGGYGDDYFDLRSRPQESQPDLSPSYPRYLRKLLSNASLVPYETFSHPVACMIAVSSHHPAPIEALRQLYVSTGQGSNQSPAWVGTEYLRYYVLIHDEEKDDITKSTALFDLMKRHFGLHCHLLRLRGSQCVQTDDDSSKVPQCEWLSAEEEIDHIRKRGRLVS